MLKSDTVRNRVGVRRGRGCRRRQRGGGGGIRLIILVDGRCERSPWRHVIDKVLPPDVPQHAICDSLRQAKAIEFVLERERARNCAQTG